MRASNLVGLALCLFLVLAPPSAAQHAANDQTTTSPDKTTTPAVFLKSLVGSWEGVCRTWFRPDKLADQSKIKGEFRPILGGRFLRHKYEGELQGQPRTGEETIAFNSVAKKFQISWIDEFHMNEGIMFSEGEPAETGFVVVGKYEVSPPMSRRGAGKPYSN